MTSLAFWFGLVKTDFFWSHRLDLFLGKRETRASSIIREFLPILYQPRVQEMRMRILINLLKRE